MLGGGGAWTAAGGQSPRQAETSQGIILMSALSAISKCRTEIRLGTGRKSASREAGSVVLRVVTPEGLGSFYFRWKSLPGAGLQACHVSTQEAVAGGSGIQGHFPLHSQFEASLSSYHGDFTDDEKCEVENPNQTRSSLQDFMTSECLFRVQGESQEIGFRKGASISLSAGQRDAACCSYYFCSSARTLGLRKLERSEGGTATG